MKAHLTRVVLVSGVVAAIAHAGPLSVSNMKGFASNPIVDNVGVLLTGADPVIVAVGTFASEPSAPIPGADVTVGSDAYATLLAEFTQYGAVGDLLQPVMPLNLQGVFSFQDNAPVAASPLEGKSIYVVVAVGADLATATEVAIFRTGATFETADDGDPLPKLVGLGTTLETVTIVGSESRFTASASVLDTTAEAAYSLAEIEPPSEIAVEYPVGTELVDGLDMVDFGTVAPGGFSERTFTIRNLGTGDLDLTGTPLVKIDGTDFTVVTDPVTPVPSGLATTFTVRFTPSGGGGGGALLHIANDDADENPFDLSLTGARETELAGAFNSDSDVALTIDGFDAPGMSLNFTLGFAPLQGTALTVVDNTGAGPIVGTLDNLADGGTIGADFGGTTYYFTADYSGGDGNNLVLTTYDPSATAVLVTDTVSGSVLRYDVATGASKTFIPSSAFMDSPQGMAVGPNGNIYVLDYDPTIEKSQVLEFDGLSGAYLGVFIDLPGGITSGSYLAFDAAGNLYVQIQPGGLPAAELILKFDPTGMLPPLYFDPIPFGTATGIGVGPDDLVYLAVIDPVSLLPDIVRYDSDGGFIDTFVDDVGTPVGYGKLIWDGQGGILATSRDEGVIRRFNAATGAVAATFDPPGSDYRGLGRLPDGSLLAGDVVTDSIYRVASDGTDLGTFATGVGAWDIIPQPVPPVFPEITVEQPEATALTDGAAPIDFGTEVVGGSGGAVVFTVRNDGNADLASLAVTLDGAGAGNFTLDDAGFPVTLAIGASATLSVTFAPAEPGTLSAGLHIASNDGDENPFDIDLGGLALSFLADGDGDGLNDASEWQMAALGFDWQVTQTGLVDTLFDHANGAGLFTQTQLDDERTAGRNDVIGDPNTYSLYAREQLQALKPEAPLIARDPSTGLFTLTMDWKKSVDLQTFADLPALPAEVSVSAEGNIEFEFASPEPAAFFRVESE